MSDDIIPQGVFLKTLSGLNVYVFMFFNEVLHENKCQISRVSSKM